MDPAHEGTGPGAWHDTSIARSLSWSWSCHSLSYVLRARAFSHKLELERPHLPHQVICQLVRRGHLPPPHLRLSHHVSPAGRGDDSAHRQYQLPIARNQASLCLLFVLVLCRLVFPPFASRSHLWCQEKKKQAWSRLLGIFPSFFSHLLWLLSGVREGDLCSAGGRKGWRSWPLIALMKAPKNQNCSYREQK